MEEEIQQNEQNNGQNITNEIQNQQLTKNEQDKIQIPHLPQKKYEVTSKYNKRKQIYELVYKDLQDLDKAICYSNIYANIVFLGNTYSQELTEKVMAYANNLSQ
ncbi:hypothetical protein PPERSA_01576 [Pseudocohnilembus persalinus]|uniref:XRN2-binding (XTBD) domain-containing protein n=1 Tax=Pseudocohnilembus persalinus TaxID=266149 RepID=A0A0V0QHV2_PSEPJ|nr:hypothetical protein PPERSA_01576 [Pseudocohnilembus persalinus]|eukprot:KRX01706.1 hypothetical protein PPERSA_01576 [Pseudocohnilembus persalinus]